jgi:hypothetical protein
MTYIHPFWLKMIALALIAIVGILTPSWWVFFLLVIPAFLVVQVGWKVDPPSDDKFPDGMA